MSERKALTQRGAEMDPRTKVSICDFAILQLRLMIDGLKDGAVFVMSSLGFGTGLLFGRHGRRRFFYKMMRVSERLDLWLNLHGAMGRGRGSGWPVRNQCGGKRHAAGPGRADRSR